MPLRVGSGQRVVSTNIKEMLGSFKQSGRIGNTHPKSMQKARQIAAAAAYRKAGETLAGGKRKR